jgi:putative CocE/NonD family hydrolase
VGERFRGWLKDHAVDHFGFEGKHREIEVPALTVTGWYDQQIGAIKHFTGMARNGRTERARSGQRLIIGPWTHTNVDWASKVGDVDFGPEATRDYYDVAEGWFAHWLKGEPTGVDEWPPIQLFVMGANRWRGESEWPLARTTYTKLYLRDGGRLSEEPPADESADRYVYDPRDPVMSLYTAGGQQEPHDLRQLDGRADVLVYATPPLEQPLEVTGPVEVRLWAASSALDTDFVARLVDVWPDGFAQELCHGIVRARYRESYTEPSLLRPGQVYEYTIRVNPTSNLFGRGHRVRLDITSSDFPNFDRNHNTGADDYADATLTTAEQTVFHDRLRPSAVVLPIIP